MLILLCCCCQQYGYIHRCGLGGGGGGWSHAVSWVIYFVLPWPWGHSTCLHGIKFDMGMLNMSGVCSLYCAAPRCGYIHKAVCGHQ